MNHLQNSWNTYNFGFGATKQTYISCTNEINNQECLHLQAH